MSIPKSTATILLAAATLAGFVGCAGDRVGTTSDQPVGNTVGTPVAGGTEPSQETAGVQASTEPRHRIELEITAEGETTVSAKVEEGSIVFASEPEAESKFGFRPSVVEVEGVEGPLVRLELVETHGSGESETATEFGTLYVKEGEAGSIQSPDGKGTIVVQVTHVEPPTT